MNDHDSENEFLDELYALSAKEKPPEALDQAILQQARTDVPKSSMAPLIKWQRYLSVAAVMVLSIYIFFDVGELSMEAETYTAKPDSIKVEGSEVVVEQALPIQEPHPKTVLSKEQHPMSPEASLTTKRAKKMAVTSSLEDALSEQSLRSESVGSVGLPEKTNEQGINFQSEKQQLLNKAKPENKLVESLKIKQINVDQAEMLEQGSESASVREEPELMLREIERLIAVGRLEEAKVRYQIFAESYPEYPVPMQIKTALK